jgi:pimeloyl-ACP methyl ester carboxylesterase
MSADGTRLHAAHRTPADGGRAVGGRGLGIVLVPGFSGSWRQERVGRVARDLAAVGGVVTVDMRGHGRSDGATTLGLREPADAAAAIAWARERYDRVALVGFSMGAAVVLRTAALYGGVDAVAAVSGPAYWYYRGTAVMRRLHWAVERRAGRGAIRVAMGTRVSSERWPDPPPLSPVESAAVIAPTPLLIVHGDRDQFFPHDHPRALHTAALAGVARAGGRAECWLERGFGHAEGAITAELTARIGAWLADATATPGTPAAARRLQTV